MSHEGVRHETGGVSKLFSGIDLGEKGRVCTRVRHGLPPWVGVTHRAPWMRGWQARIRAKAAFPG